MRQRLARVWVRCARTVHLNGGGQADVRRACPYAKLIRAALDLPAAGLCVPVAERLVVQRQGDGLALPCLQPDLCEGLQLLRGAEDPGVGLGRVDLYDLGTGAAARVCHGQGHAAGVGFQVAVGKTRVAQAVAERKRHGHTRGLVVAVADVQPLAVLHGASRTCKVVLGGGVGVGIGPGLGQLAGRIDFAGQHIDHCARAGLAAEGAVDECPAVGQPRRFQRRARADDDDSVGVGLLHGLQKLDLVVGQLHVGAVQTLALLDLVQP